MQQASPPSSGRQVLPLKFVNLSSVLPEDDSIVLHMLVALTGSSQKWTAPRGLGKPLLLLLRRHNPLHLMRCSRTRWKAERMEVRRHVDAGWQPTAVPLLLRIQMFQSQN
jgi:hypothetical protein